MLVTRETCTATHCFFAVCADAQLLQQRPVFLTDLVLRDCRHPAWPEEAANEWWREHRLTKSPFTPRHTGSDSNLLFFSFPISFLFSYFFAPKLHPSGETRKSWKKKEVKAGKFRKTWMRENGMLLALSNVSLKPCQLQTGQMRGRRGEVDPQVDHLYVRAFWETYFRDALMFSCSKIWSSQPPTSSS